MTKMEDLEVRELGKSEYKLWDDLVEKSPHGTIFHTSDWLEVSREVLNNNHKIYGCFQNNELIGGCSLFIKKTKGIFKMASSTCEMTPYGGIVLKESPSTKVKKQVFDTHRIMNSLREFLCDRFDNIEIKLSPDFLDIRPFTWNGWNSNVLYTYYIELDRDINIGISKDLKKNIQNALNEGMKTKRLKNSKIYYDLFSLVFKRQKLTTPVNEVFFNRVIELLESKKIGDMWVTETSSAEYVASQIRLWDKKRVYAWTGASDHSFRNLGSNSLIYYDVFKDLKVAGFKEINMMAANTQRFTDFITGFNPKLVPYYSINFSSRRYRFFKKMYSI